MLTLSGIEILVNTDEAIGKDYYVSAGNEGSDKNPGTQEAPFLTLAQGVSVLLPGDTLFVRGGTYLGSSSLSNIPSGNSWAEPVTVKAYPAEKVVFTAMPEKSVLHFGQGSHHIIIDGFVFDGTGGLNGIASGEDSHHIHILNSEVMNAPIQGILLNKGSAYFEFVNLRIHNNGTTWQHHGIYISTSHHLVKDCLIYQNAGWGVHIFSATNAPSFNLVINNKMHNNAQGKTEFGGKTTEGAGIGIYHGTGNAAINNLIWGRLQRGIHTYRTSNTKIYNNTLYANRRGIEIEPTVTGAQVINNIVYKNESYDLKDLGVNTTLSNNLTINPLFVDEEKLDFHLQPGGPAINAGMILPEVTTDFEYKIRPTDSNYDIGAFQNGKNSLLPPTALRVIGKSGG
ncbi:MAG: right-handed parallel beta-helix repeat-containing protein [Nitrospirales bacterium]|nr:right-handed parallel beta-helix repeat-containing protein [Nitrospirales bacterium]